MIDYWGYPYQDRGGGGGEGGLVLPSFHDRGEGEKEEG